MSDYAQHRGQDGQEAPWCCSAGLTFALATLVILIVGGAGIVAFLLWPRSVPVAPDAPSLPNLITVGGVLFNVPPAAIRVPLQRRPGAHGRRRSRLPVAVAGAASTRRRVRRRPNRLPPIDPHLHHHRAAVDRGRAERPGALDLSALSRRDAVRRTGRPEGDRVQGRHALSGRGFVFRPRRCSRASWCAARVPARRIHPARVSTIAASSRPT